MFGYKPYAHHSAIDDMPVSARARNVLRNIESEMDIKFTLFDIARIDVKRLLNSPNCGWKTVAEIREALEGFGIQLNGSNIFTYEGVKVHPWYEFCE